jgi:protein-tyrosine phosphatase
MPAPEILVVCTGNICRSPLGEAALRARVDGRARVVSAGTYGQEGSGATEGSVVAGRELGLDLGSHRARRIGAADIDAASLILAMEREHRDAVVWAVPGAADRTFTLKELVLLLERGPLAGDLDERLAEAARRRATLEADGDLDVADPYGDTLDAYRRIAGEIDAWTERLVAALFGPALAATGSR